MSSQEPQAAPVGPPEAKLAPARPADCQTAGHAAGPANERRERVRHSPFSAPSVRLRAPGVPPVPTRVMDLSEAGIGIVGPENLQAERTVALDLDLNLGASDSQSLRVVGQVAWAGSSGRAGIRFLSLDHATQQAIQQWLFLNAVATVTQSERIEELVPSAARFEDNGAAALGPGLDLFPDEVDPDVLELENVRFRTLSPLEAAVNGVVSRALALTGAKGAALALYEGDQLICRAICGTDTPGLGATISTDSGITGECVRLGRVMYSADSATDSLVDREICADLCIRSILALPLYAGERLVGLLEVLSQRPSAFAPSDARALDLLARPAIGGLFAEGPSELLHRPAPNNSPNFAADSSDVDLAELEQGRAFARKPTPRARLYRRLLEATAGVAVIAAVGWLVITQTKTLASLRQVRSAASLSIPASIPAEVPHLAPAPTAEEKLAELKSSAEKGDPVAEYGMGARFATGEGVAQDYAAAARWFRLAANKGYAPAQGMMGAYYWSGRGVTKDLKKAYFWSVLARDGNDEISRDRVETLTPRMNRDELLEVQQRVHDWNLKHAVVTAAVSSPGTAASR